MCIQVAGYAAIGILVALGIDGGSVPAAVFIAGYGQGIAFPRLYNTVLGEVPPQQAGVASGIVNSALQVGGAVSAAAIGSLFFTMLGGGHGERAYAFAFAIAQATLTAALFGSMLSVGPAPTGCCRGDGDSGGTPRAEGVRPRENPPRARRVVRLLQGAIDWHRV